MLNRIKKSKKINLKKQQQKICFVIGFALILFPIFFDSNFEYNGKMPILQFIFAALPFIFIVVGFLLIFVSEGQIRKTDENKKERR